MSVVARRVRATPFRSAADTWQVIADLLAPKNSAAHAELLNIEGIGASIISTESPKNASIVVCGSGPRVRIYCLYGDEAVSGDDASESPLAQYPTDDDWAMSLSADADDVAWVKESLAKRSTHVTVREKSESVEADDSDSHQAHSGEAVINMEAFLRP
jgi:hypothetical protein